MSTPTHQAPAPQPTAPLTPVAAQANQESDNTWVWLAQGAALCVVSTVVGVITAFAMGEPPQPNSMDFFGDPKLEAIPISWLGAFLICCTLPWRPWLRAKRGFRQARFACGGFFLPPLLLVVKLALDAARAMLGM